MNASIARWVGRALCLTLLASVHAADAEENVKSPVVSKTNPDTVFLYADDNLSSPLPTRLRAKKGDDVVVWYDGCKVGKVTIDEKKRERRIYSDLEKLIGSIKKDNFLLVAPAGSCPAPTTETHTILYDRSTLTVTAFKNEDKDIKAEEASVVNGPDEHLFLSIDLPISNRKTLKFDKASGTLQPRDDNGQFYVGLNWMIGDVLGDDKPVRSWGDWTVDPLTIKAMFKLSSKPFDSVGLGLGYTIPRYDKKGFGPVTIFVGHFWTKEDAIVDGLPRENERYGKSWRLGVSYSLDDAAGWLKK